MHVIVKRFTFVYMERKLEILDSVSKVRFCQVAGISRPTLYKYLRGEDVIPAMELAIMQAKCALEEKAQPATAA